MEIKIELNGNDYGIILEPNQYIPIKYSEVKDEKSKNFGSVKTTELGYFTSLPNACKFLIRTEISSKSDKITLLDFVKRVEDLNSELTNQLKLIQLD